MGKGWCWITVLWVMLTACVPTPTPMPVTTPTVIRVVGASDLVPLAETVQDALANTAEPVEVLFTPANSTVGWRQLRQGKADVALLSWPPEAVPQGFTLFPVGQDGIALIVHPRVGVTSLSVETARRLFTGRYLSWADLGGQDVPVRLVSREEGSGTRQAFEALLMADMPIALTTRVVPSGQDMVAFVARREGAVGYVSMGLVDRRVQVLALNGVLPTPSNVRTGTYPLVRTMYVATAQPPTLAAQVWLAAWRTPAVQARLAQLYPSLTVASQE